jgi:SAM-dependent methyltransferase
MPTLPPEPEVPSRSAQLSTSAPPYRQRQIAESFGTNAARYDRARPSYPDALVRRIVATSPGRDLIDVGCGTGITGRLFQTAGCRVLGVDPDPRMADLARQGGLDVEVAKFEDWDPAGRAFDAVTAGQAWHWVDPVAGAARAAQALRPGGLLALFWNSFLPPPGLNEAFTEVIRRVLPDSPIAASGLPGPDGYSTLCVRAGDAMLRAGGFGPPEQWRFDWERPYTRDEWLDALPTFGGMSLLPPGKLADLTAGVGAAIDAVGGGFTMGYATVAVAAVRSAAAS